MYAGSFNFLLNIGSFSLTETVWQLDIFADFEVESLGSKETGNEISGCGDGAVDRNNFGPFGILVLADDELSELTPIYFCTSNAKTFFCADETRFVTLETFVIVV